MNEAVHVLRRFDAELSLGVGATVDDYERLVIVRNAIAHNAGIAPGYKYEVQLRKAVDSLKGFSITNWHFIGDCVKIKRDALCPYIQAMGGLLPRVWEEADRTGKLKL